VKKDIYIFVLDRGFVIVGEAEIHPSLALHWHMPKSMTIRSWGTTKGLAELIHGPLEKTVTDPVCERTTPFRSVLDIIHVSDRGRDRWRKRLS
jgi:hypothetical protein